jgi:type VII secretion protein EccE
MSEPIPGAAPTLPARLARFRFHLRLRQVICAEIVAAVLIWVLPWSQWWVPVIIAAVVALVATAAYRGATAPGWVGRVVRFRRYRRGKAATRRAVIAAPSTVELTGSGAVGVRWDGNYAVTMIALHGRAYAPTFLDPSGAKTEDTAPLSVVAGLLRQFGGLELASVDVVSAGQRTSPAAFSATYDEIIGDRPAVGMRHSWLVLRLCPQACLAAMAYRGDATAAAAAATERIRQAVVRSGCRAVTCTAEQISEATDILLGGVELGQVKESWSHADAGTDYVTSYRVAGADLGSGWVNDVWAVPSRLTVLTVRLAATVTGEVTAGALVRFHTPRQLTHPPVLELSPVSGQVFDALAASLPLGDRALRLPLSVRELDPSLEVPITPAGLMIGMTVSTGLPVLVAAHDPLRLTRVALQAELSVVQQFVLRATATGSTVLVHTGRPQAWVPICGEHIWLEDPGPGRGPITMVVLDGDDIQSPAMSVGERGHTVVSVSSMPPPDADVVITQVAAGELVLSTPRMGRARLQIVRPRNETHFLAHLRGGARAEPVRR